jgi:hypothetical protein
MARMHQQLLVFKGVAGVFFQACEVSQVLLANRDFA